MPHSNKTSVLNQSGSLSLSVLDLAAIRTILESETSSQNCPNCNSLFDKGKKRKLIDTCGHEICWSCMFKNESCAICAKIQKSQNQEIQYAESNRETSNLATGFGSTQTILCPQTNSGCISNYMQPNTQKPPKVPQHSLSHLRGLVDLTSRQTSMEKIYATPPQTRRKFFIPKHLSSFGFYKNRNAGSENNTFSDDESRSSKSKSKTVRDDELEVRLGLFLDSNRSKYKQSLSSLSSNTSPLSTLTNSSETEIRRDKLQNSKRGCDSIGSLLSVSISEHSNASSNSLDRRQSLPGHQKQFEYSDELGYFKTRKTAQRSSLRSMQHSSSSINDPKMRFAQYQAAQVPLKPLFFEVPHQESDPIFIGRSWLFREISDVLTGSDQRGVLINGKQGSGKTSAILKMVEYSCFGNKSQQEAQEQDGICSQINVPNERLRQLSRNVVAYHFCQSDNSSTCTVPDFVHSLAAQLTQAPQLTAYNELLLSEPHLQNILSIKECIADPIRAFKMGILEPLELLKRNNKIFSRYCIILIDSLCESEYHRPDFGDTIGTFLNTMVHSFPQWLKVIATVRSQMTEYTNSLPFARISLDSWSNEIQKDVHDFIVHRVSFSSSIQNNISSVGTFSAREGSVGKFTQTLSNLSNGSFLFVKLTLDLIERGNLVIKSNSFKVLPVSLHQIFLLNFNLRYPTTSAFDKISSILAICLAALHPLTLIEIFHSFNSLVTEAPLGWHEFINRFKMLAGFLVKRMDNTYSFFHPSLREWLIRRDENDNSKFLVDHRVGHAAIAFRMSRLQAPLDDEQTIAFCHHVLKAHIYRNSQLNQSPRDLQAYWVTSSSKCVSSSLCFIRNIFCPNLKVSRLLLLSGAHPDHKTNLFGDATLLCIAANEGIMGLVSLLLEFGANVDACNSQGCTALMFAAIKGHFEIVQQLVSAGSSLTASDTQKRSALVLASLHGHNQIVKYLLTCDWNSQDFQSDPSYTAKQQALVAAASRGHSSIVKELLEIIPELDIDGLDHITGENALTVAAANGHIETVVTLLSHGANYDGKNRKGVSSLFVAVKEGNWNIVERLIECGADLNSKDANGRSPLSIAAEEGHVAIIELLMNKGADLNAIDKDGLSPLSWSCLRGKLLASKSLLERDANIHHEDNHQRTPLDLAAYQGSPELCQLLLENGSQIEHVDEKGMRAIDRAIASNNIKVVQVFLKHGAKLGSATWKLSENKPEINIILLNKLLEDGNILYRKKRLQDASHRYSYALKKIQTILDAVPKETEDSNDSAQNVSTTYQRLKFNFLVNLSRCKRKLNEMSEAVDLATLAIVTKPNNYDGYYARAKALMEENKFTAALMDANLGLEKIKIQQKYQKISPEVRETLENLCDELNKRVESCTFPERSYRHETTDL